MYRFLTTLLSCSAVMSIISLVYIAAAPLLTKKYSAKWLYYIWLLVVIGWVVPFRPSLGINIAPFQISKMQVAQTKYVILNSQLNIMNNEMKGISSISIWLIIVCIWAFGFAVMIVNHTWRHHCFLKMVKRWSKDITNQDILHNFDALKAEANIRRHIGLKTCLSVSSPMMIGFFRPTILLPSINNTSDELIFILRHELIHLKRNDLWYKALVLLVTAIHWFNPAVYFMARAIEIQCEISCDESLLKQTNFQQRMKYGEILIGAVRNGTKMHTALSTDFYSKENIIKTRIFRIMDTTKKSAGIIILCLAFITVIGSGIAYASDSTYDSSTHTQIIHVDVEELKAGNIICFEGPYQLEAGDIIRYDITSDNNENMYVDIIRNDSITYGRSVMNQRLNGYILAYPNNQVQVNSAIVGKCCVFVKFKNLGAGHDIKGTIEIIRKGEK